MKSSGHRVPKSLLVKMLAVLGLKINKSGRMEWTVSGNGHTEYFTSMRAIFFKYRKAGDATARATIDPIAMRIEKAIQ